MKAFFTALLLLIEFGLSCLVAFGIVVMAGWVDEVHRSYRANIFGKIVVTIALVQGLAPLISTLWITWRRFFSNNPWSTVPLGLYLPFALMLAAALAAAVLLFLFDLFGYTAK